MSKGQQTKARLVEKTAELIAAQGYHATGINQITKESGTPMGSLYYHFPGGKDELVTSAMQAGSDLITQALHGIFSTNRDVSTAIRSIVELLSEQLERSAFMKGCPIATVTLETAAQNDMIQSLSQTIYRGWQVQIVQYLAQSGYDEQIASSLALFVVTVIEGGLLLSRAERSTIPLQQAGEQLIRFLGTYQQKV